MKFYWINTNASEHRRSFMQNQFQNLPFQNERIEGITPKDLNKFVIEKHQECGSTDFEIACILSHLNAIQKGYDEKHEYFIVCEDDMIIPFIDIEKLLSYIKNYENKINDKVEVLQLFTSGSPYIIQLYNEFFVKQKTLFKKIEDDIYSGTGIYLVSREGASKILKKYVKDKVNNSYDLSYSSWAAADHYMYIVAKSYIITYPFFVSNTNFGSDIHEDHCQNHKIAINIILQIQQKNNQLDILIKSTNNKIIQTYLYSDLYDQLFMIFTTIAYSIKHEFDFLLYSDISKTLDNKNKTYFNNLLSKLKYKTTPHIAQNVPLYEEKEFAHIEIPIQQNSFNLKGLFQSFKYFEKEYEQIMKITGINDVRTTVFNDFQHVFAKPCISLHFRRNELNYTILPIDYYQNAIKYLEKHIDIQNYNILLFSDHKDNEKVEKIIVELKKQFSYDFLKVSDNIPDWKQMMLMSFCKHHIISNSTFSWWGAYMCENSDKIVCTPSKWFENDLTNQNTKDLYPDSWITIDF